MGPRAAAGVCRPLLAARRTGCEGPCPARPCAGALETPRRPFGDLACANAGTPRPDDEQRAAKAAMETPACKVPAGDDTPVRRLHWPVHHVITGACQRNMSSLPRKTTLLEHIRETLSLHHGVGRF